jgi:hypothetical protein
VKTNAVKYVGLVAFGNGLQDIPRITEMVGALTAVPFKEYAAAFIPEFDTPEKLEAVRLATAEAFGRSFPELYYIGLGFGIAGCIASILVGDMSKFMDEHVAVILH